MSEREDEATTPVLVAVVVFPFPPDRLTGGLTFSEKCGINPPNLPDNEVVRKASLPRTALN